MQASQTMPTAVIGRHRTVVFLGWSAGVMLTFALSAALVRAHTLRIEGQRTVLQRVNALGPRVLVMRLQDAVHSQRIPIPASIHGYIETPIYAKTAGYLKTIYVDKGDIVHKGEVLAILESPELDKEVADAKANYWLQKVTDTRYQALVAQQVVPQQTAENSCWRCNRTRSSAPRPTGSLQLATSTPAR
jgi:multidrug efflux pump subunit AcrA (membrane-fusion protein)